MIKKKDRPTYIVGDKIRFIDFEYIEKEVVEFYDYAYKLMPEDVKQIGDYDGFVNDKKTENLNFLEKLKHNELIITRIIVSNYMVAEMQDGDKVCIPVKYMRCIEKIS